MATTIDPITGIIYIPKADLQLVQSSPTEIRQLDLNVWRLELRDIETDEHMLPWPKTHDHNEDVTIGGVTLADVLIILPPYTITFEDGQYAVNLVGVNSNVGDRVNVNQVSIRSANSAGLTFSQEIQWQSYLENSVYYKSTGFAGSLYPRGIPTDTVNNLTDAITILGDLGLNKINLGDDLNLDQNVSGLKFWCELGVAVFNPSGYKAEGCIFERVTLGGNFNGSMITITQCWVTGASGASGVIHDSNLSGTIVARPNEVLAITNCRPVTAGFGGMTIDMNPGNACEIKLNDLGGSATVVNCDMPNDKLEVTTIAGKLVIDLTTCTDGEINISGVANVEDQDGNYLASGSYGNLTVVNEGISGKQINAMYLGIERKVFIDSSITTPGYIGDGSQGKPFNDFVTGKDWAEEYGVKTLVIYNDETLITNGKDFIIIGIGNPTIDLNSENVNKTVFIDCALEGLSIGRCRSYRCTFLTSLVIDGEHYNTSLKGDITVIDGGDILLSFPISYIPGAGRPSVSANATGTCKINVRGLIGGLDVRDFNQTTDIATIDGLSAEVSLATSCSKGEIKLRGDILPEFNQVPDAIDPINVIIEPLSSEVLMDAIA